MWPKEHGAYGQLAFPLVTGFAVAGVNGAALLVAVAAMAGFLSHEPLLVLLGRRGSRLQRVQRRQAIMWLFATALVAVIAGIGAVLWTTASVWWIFALPLVPAILYAIALTKHAEKTTTGEVAAAFAFSLIAVPLCVAAGAPVGAGLSVGLSFAALSAASTLGVRVVILRVRAGGDPDAVATTRRLLAIVVVSMMTALLLLASWAALPRITIASIVPGLLVSLVLAFRPPPPTRLRSVGWTLLTTSAIATVLLVVGLRLR
jgi:hypothetical protein